MKLNRIKASACAASIALGLAVLGGSTSALNAAGLAFGMENADDEEVLTGRESLASDVDTIAKTYDLPASTVAEQLGLQRQIDRIPFEKLDAGFAAVNSTVGDAFRVDYLSSSDDVSVVKAAFSDAGLARYVEFHRVPLNEAELMAAISRVSEYEPDVRADLDGNYYTGEVIALVEKMPPAEFRSEVERVAGAPVVWRVADTVFVNDVAGGRVIDTAGNPQQPGSTCTAGFVVFDIDNTTNRGITTAEHCAVDQPSALYDPGGLDIPMDKESGAHKYFWDLAWYDNQSTPWGAVVFTGDGTRDVNSRGGRASQDVGDIVCGYGRVTGKTCATIISKILCPNTVPNCSPVWMHTEGTGGNISNNGDSGGPIFTGSRALGWHSKGSCYASNPSFCPGWVYMAQDYSFATSISGGPRVKVAVQ